MGGIVVTAASGTAYGGKRDVRWPMTAACGCYLTGGRVHEWPPGSDRWVCERHKLGPLAAAVPPRRPAL
jgi:hypothetical protein